MSITANLLSPIQFGVGIPSGCEQVVHRLQHQLTRSHPQRLAGIAVDFRNAFNQRTRNDILNELYKYEQLKPIWKMVEWAYSNPSTLWIRNDANEMVQPSVLQSSEGVKQGDPLGSILFALSVKPIYDAAVESDPTGGVSGIALHDDFTLVGLPDMNLLNAFCKLRQIAKQGGLEVNMTKTNFLWLHDKSAAPLDRFVTEEVKHKLSELGVGIVTGATKILGAPIGTDIKLMQAIAMETFNTQQRFFDLVASNQMPEQEALLLLRLSGVPRFNYLARTTSPHILMPVAIEFDRKIMEVVRTKFQLPALSVPSSSPTSSSSFSSSASSPSSSALSNEVVARAYHQLSLPMRLGGLGIRSAVEMLPLAYVASIVRNVYEDQHWWKENGPTDENNFSLLMDWQNAIDAVSDKLMSKNHRQYKRLYPVDTDISRFVKQVEAAKLEERMQKKKTSESEWPNLVRLQSELNAAVAKISFHQLRQQLVSSGSKRDVERLNRLTHSKSGSHIWLSVIPTDSTLKMSGDAMRLAIRHRLGLPPYDTMPTHCICGVSNAYQDDPYHSFSCSSLRSHGIIFRHNLLLHRIAVWTRRAGLYTELEVSHLSSDSRLRPDLVVMNGSETLIIDATVVNPLNKTNMNRVQNNKSSSGKSSSNRSSSANISSSSSSSSSINSGVDMINIDSSMTAIKTAEEAKKKKYAKLMSENGHGRFVTAAMESTGGMGKEFRELVDLVCLVSQEENGGWSAEEVGNGIRGAAAIAIQMGNARIIMESRQRLAKRAVEWDRRVQRAQLTQIRTESVGVECS
jgi:reverse transcriptase-like protein